MYNVYAATSWSSRAGVWPSLGQWKGLERVDFLRASMACLLSMKMTGESQYWRFLEEYNYRQSTALLHYNSNGVWFRYIIHINTLKKTNIYCILKLSNMLYILVQIFLGFFFLAYQNYAIFIHSKSKPSLTSLSRNAIRKRNEMNNRTETVNVKQLKDLVSW